MRLFQFQEIREALLWAECGNQALHLHRILSHPASAPECFKQAIANGEDIAHLFDQDQSRLARTARDLGVGVCKIDRPRSRWQHIDLCGLPLQRALSLCNTGGL